MMGYAVSPHYHRWHYTRDEYNEWLRGLDAHDPVQNGELLSSKRVRWWHMRNFPHHWNYVEFTKTVLQNGLLYHYEYIVRNLIPPFANRLSIGIDDTVLNGERTFTEADCAILSMLLQNGFVITVDVGDYRCHHISSTGGDLIIEEDGAVRVENDLLDVLQGYKWHKREYPHITHPDICLSQSDYTNLILDYLIEPVK